MTAKSIAKQYQDGAMMMTLTYSPLTQPETIDEAAKTANRFVCMLLERNFGRQKGATIWTKEALLSNFKDIRYHHIVIMPRIADDVEEEWGGHAGGVATCRELPDAKRVWEVAVYAQATMDRQEGAF